MATEVTFKSIFAGRLPAVPGGAKVPGPGLKIKYGLFTLGTAEYPDGGYVAADLEPLVGFTRIEAIIPCGYAADPTSTSAENFWGVSWHGNSRTLQIVANRAQDGNALTVGTGQVGSELATNDASADSTQFAAIVIGY